MKKENYVCPELHEALIEANLELVNKLEECDHHLRQVLLGAAKVSRPSYNDKRAFDRFQKWRDDCQEAEKWRSLSSDNTAVSREVRHEPN